jgi:hypothetical protein
VTGTLTVLYLIGGAEITVFGKGFAKIQTVYVNGLQCVNRSAVTPISDPPQYDNATAMVTCVLPGQYRLCSTYSKYVNVFLIFSLGSIVGTGYDQPIVVFANQQFSEPKLLLSYAPPNIIALTGCKPSLLVTGSTVGCNRNGGDIITIGNS